MTRTERDRLFWRYFLLALSVLGGLYFLYLVRSVLLPFVVSGALAILLSPLLEKLESHGISRPLGTVLVFVVFSALVVGLASYAARVLLDESQALASKITHYVEDFQAKGYDPNNTIDWLTEKLRLDPKIGASLKEQVARLPETASQSIRRIGETLTSGLTAVGQSLAGLLWMILVPILTFYFLLDLPKIRYKFFMLFPRDLRDDALRVEKQIGSVFTAYLRGMMIVSGCYGVTATIVFLIFGLPFAGIMGAVAGLLYILPYIGPLLTVTLAGVVSFVSCGYGYGQPAAIIAILLAANLAFDQIVTPQLIGSQVGLHPLLSIFAMMCGGSLFQIPGMILAIPVAGSAQVVLCAAFPELKERLAKPMSKKETKPDKKSGAPQSVTPTAPPPDDALSLK